MERLGRAPASDAAPACHSGSRRVPATANAVRCRDMKVPFASIISELYPLPAGLPVSES
jgi:hypothetical protein